MLHNGGNVQRALQGAVGKDLTIRELRVDRSVFTLFITKLISATCIKSKIRIL
jgi:hypothetical protein